MGTGSGDTVSLRDHLQRQIDQLQRVVRDLEQVSQTHVVRAEFDVVHQRLIEQVNAELARIRDHIDNLEARIDRAEGKGLGLNAGWLYLLGGVGALGTLVTISTLLYHLSH